MSKHYPELFKDLRLPRLQPILELGHFFLSPSEEQHGSRILVIKAGK